MMRLKKITLLKERVTQPHQYPFNIPRSHRTRAKNEEWRTQGDDFRTFLGDFVAYLPQLESHCWIERIA
jgi:hypothetical protein